MHRISMFHGEHRFLSNFHPCPWPIVTARGPAPTVEHAYQAAKTEDPELAKRILAAATPGGAKRLGKEVLVLRPGWDRRKVEVMRGLLMQKFDHPDLRRQLLETGDAELVEGNHWGDTFWGVCNGRGQNMLGRLLMETRAFYGNTGNA